MRRPLHLGLLGFRVGQEPCRGDLPALRAAPPEPRRVGRRAIAADELLDGRDGLEDRGLPRGRAPCDQRDIMGLARTWVGEREGAIRGALEVLEGKLQELHRNLPPGVSDSPRGVTRNRAIDSARRSTIATPPKDDRMTLPASRVG